MEGQFSHYEILGPLGSGGMGEVYRARDLRLRREVALKILSPGFAEDDERRARFLRESRLAASLSHPNVATVYEADEVDGRLFFAMELVEGKTLQEKIQPGGLRLNEFLDFAIPLAEGLAAAHEAGIVHRDLKPGNTMVDERGTVKILDFGLSRMDQEVTNQTTALTQTFQVMGTPQYMSPEQVQGLKVDARSDLFSMGTMLYELASGKRPFSGKTHQEVMDSITGGEHVPIQRASPQIDDRLAQIIDQLLEKRRDDRIQTAAGLIARLRQLRAVKEQKKTIRRRVAIWAGIAAVAVMSLGIAWALGLFAVDRERWNTIDRIERLADEEEWEAAYELTKELEAAFPDEPEVESLWPLFSRQVSIESSPAGAAVYRRAYTALDGQREFLGSTPLHEIHIPRGLHRLWIELDGYRTLEATHLAPGPGWNTRTPRPASLAFDLHTAESTPDDTVHVAAWRPDDFYLSDPPPELPAYLIDKYEVTNRQFKEFLDAGGYREKRYWVDEFVKDGQVLQWEEAVAEFTDSTGQRPGPSTWMVGNYPAGRADHPVTGVSWYEADAYARFDSERSGSRRGLPTVFHWKQAIRVARSAWILPLSNIDNRSDGLAPVGQYQGISYIGVYDMVGNAREWCFNGTGDQRFILGGGWSDPYYYGYLRWVTQPPFDRASTNGFRLMTYLDETGVEAAQTEITERAVRDFDKAVAASDDQFGIYRSRYDYDNDLRTNPLDHNIESTETTTHWVRERISFNAPYAGSRMELYLYTPTRGTPPYQTVVYWPGGSARRLASIEDQSTAHVDFLLMDGRAVAVPVLSGTFGSDPDYMDRFLAADTGSTLYEDYVIRWVKELRRCVDYLVDREDIIAGDKLAYHGFSWGGKLGAIVLAVDNRFETAVLKVAGFGREQPRPAVDEFNFARHVTTPVLMINGRYDDVFPLETTAIPMYEALGTASKDKLHVYSESGHFVPRKDLIALMLPWLDKYLGSVQKMN